MAWTDGVGFSFRETSAYVTDGARDQFVGVGNQVYPLTSHNSGETVTYGFPNAPTEPNGVFIRNKSLAVDVRLAGCIFVTNDGATDTYAFRVVLPSAGTYRITLAMGIAATNTMRNYWQILDDSTVLDTVDNTGTAQSPGQFADATGTIHTSAANWVSNQSTVDYVFSTTDFYLKIANPGTAVADQTGVAYLKIAQVAASSSARRSRISLLGVG